MGNSASKKDHSHRADADLARASKVGSRVTRRAWLGITLGGVATTAVGMALWRSGSPAPAKSQTTRITVHASPSCECCHKWVKHLEDNNFDVSVENAADVTPVKRNLGVPETLWSCHTATVGGYVVEGHVPADLIQKVLSERPKIAGLSAPGMPNGSPGMDGPTKETYEIIAFTRDGQTERYAVR